MKSTFAIVAFVAVAAVGGAAFATLSSAEQGGSAPESVAASGATSKAITIYRDPGCGCCDTYAEYLEGKGYEVTRINDRDFDQRSIAVGVPAQGLGCHLAEIDGYYVSGLVPAEIIERLLAEQPEITGITLPGMPINAPGMAPEKTGTLKTYAFGKGGVTLYSHE